MVSKRIALLLTDYGWFIVLMAEPKLLTDANDGDKRVIGNGIPTTYGSLNLALNYKGFDVSVMFRGAFNFQVLNRQRMHWKQRHVLVKEICQVPFSISHLAVTHM